MSANTRKRLRSLVFNTLVNDVLSANVRRQWRALALDALTIGLVLVLLFPIIWLYSTALKPQGQMFGHPLAVFPREITFDNFSRMWNAIGFKAAFRNSLLVAFASSIIATAVGLLAAFSLSRFRYRLRPAFSMTILATQMLPSIVMVVPLIIILRKLELTDSLIGLTISYLLYGLPISVWMLKGYMDDIPMEIDEAAMIDGCNAFQVLARIILPLMAPATVAVGAFAFMLAWGEYVFALALITSTESKTLPLALQAAFGKNITDWGMLTAGGTIISLPPAILFMFFQRFLIGGLTSGSIKG